MGCSLSMLQKKNGGQGGGGGGGGGDGEKKEKGSLTFVLKVDCLCEGCANKIVKCIRKFEGIIPIFISFFGFLSLKFLSFC